MLKNKNVLITGGTGTMGRALTEVLLGEHKVKKLVVFSRDESKQVEMMRRYPKPEYDNMRFFIGDVRDRQRLKLAFRGIDYVIHTAALKQVPLGEYNPSEVVETNIYGAMNVISAAIDMGVEKVIALSTDKAANPINLYGATKLCADKLFVAANSYSGTGGVCFSCVRYGNVVGSKGSVIPLFMEQKETGVLLLTDPAMTRFWITLEQGVDFVLKRLADMMGGEIFVPKIPSMQLCDLAIAVCPECRHETIGVRPGEKMHEVMISRDDARRTIEVDGFYIIQPDFPFWRGGKVGKGGKLVPENFEYNSRDNKWRLDSEGLRKMIKC